MLNAAFIEFRAAYSRLHRRSVHLSAFAWDTHTPHFRLYACICAMWLSLRVRLWYLSAGHMYKRGRLMVMNAALALDPGRAGRLAGG